METTEKMIDEMVKAIAGPGSSRRQTFYLRECLRQLVRLAKLEQGFDVKRSVAIAIGTPPITDSRKNKATIRNILAEYGSKQRRLDFEANVSE